MNVKKIITLLLAALLVLSLAACEMCIRDRMKGGRDHVSRNDVIISSSTEGSNKKFKISVDDTGAISATEV